MINDWNVYYWKAGKQFVIGDARQIVDLVGRGCFTRRYTQSNRPKTLVYICSLETFHKAASKTLKEINPRFQ